MLGQLLKRFLNHVDGLLTEINTGPLEHLGLIHEVWHGEIGALCDEFLILNGDVLCGLFLQKTLCFLDVRKCFFVCDLDLCVKFVIKFRIQSLHIGLLNQH